MNSAEFSRKYKVPKTLVYEASFWLDDRSHFEPEELVPVLIDRIEKRLAFHQEQMDKLTVAKSSVQKILTDRKG